MMLYTSFLSSLSRRLFYFAQPHRFFLFADSVLPFLGIVSLAFLCVGLFLAFSAPADYQQGFAVRIMYVHVPFAWLSLACYSMMAFFSLGILIWRHPLADFAFRAAAPIGTVFTLISLLTGSLWARPMWGTWWAWDARLASMFILFLMYLGIIALLRAFDRLSASIRPAAMIALVGFIDIPVIRFSVNWWNTLHQPASIRLGGSDIHMSFLIPLMTMTAAFCLIFLFLLLSEMRTQILLRRIYRMRLLEAISEDPA